MSGHGYGAPWFCVARRRNPYSFMIVKTTRFLLLLVVLFHGSMAFVRAAEAKTIAAFDHFDSSSAEAAGGWKSWSPRPGIAPNFKVDSTVDRSGGGSLLIAGNGNAAAVGAWQRTVPGIEAGKVYRFTARARVHQVDPIHSVFARLQWLDIDGKPVRPTDYIRVASTNDEWMRFEQVIKAPEKARHALVELFYAWAASGTVWWDEIRIAEEGTYRPRRVRLMTVFHRPQGTKSSAESVEGFCRLVENSRERLPDLVCLPEGITVVGTGMTYAEASESVPGPTTERLGRLARQLRTYVVAGLYERIGNVIYNSAVLLDRNGQLAGTYRKTHLPREEMEGGLTPGSDYPVFSTDFGKLGMMICWDVQFPEPARALALQGAEIIALPIWGGSEVLARARAIENHAYLVSSSYDMKTFIVNPAGEVLAEATATSPVATVEINLDDAPIQPWLGDMRHRTWIERRNDLPLP